MAQTTTIDTPQWRAFIALQHEQQQQYWRRAVSRHEKMTHLVTGLTYDGNRNLCHSSRRRRQGELPFYPLHCAASQGIVAAGRMILERRSGSWTQQV